MSSNHSSYLHKHLPISSPRNLAATESSPTGSLAAEDFEKKIAEAAYYKAEQRGFVPGKELEDWLAARAEFMATYPHLIPLDQCDDREIAQLIGVSVEHYQALRAQCIAPTMSVQ